MKLKCIGGPNDVPDNYCINDLVQVRGKVEYKVTGYIPNSYEEIRDAIGEIK